MALSGSSLADRHSVNAEAHRHSAINASAPRQRSAENLGFENLGFMFTIAPLRSRIAPRIQAFRCAPLPGPANLSIPQKLPPYYWSRRLPASSAATFFLP